MAAGLPLLTGLHGDPPASAAPASLDGLLCLSNGKAAMAGVTPSKVFPYANIRSGLSGHPFIEGYTGRREWELWRRQEDGMDGALHGPDGARRESIHSLFVL